MVSKTSRLLNGNQMKRTNYMSEMNMITKVTFKEVITSVETADLTGKGKTSLIITTLNGDVRVYDFHRDEKNPYRVYKKKQIL